MDNIFMTIKADFNLNGIFTKGREYKFLNLGEQGTLMDDQGELRRLETTFVMTFFRVLGKERL